MLALVSWLFAQPGIGTCWSVAVKWQITIPELFTEIEMNMRVKKTGHSDFDIF